MNVKTKRKLSGIFFRAKNEEGNMDNIVFEDLSEEEQDKILNSRTDDWVKSLAKHLANTINKIGDQFDIMTE